MTHKKSALALAFLIIICFVPCVYSQTGSLVTVHFIDVGQGDSIFIDTSDKDLLIDAGSATASQTVLDYLTNIHTVHIDLVIATHVHEDHIGGLVDILNSTLTIDEVLINNQTHTSQTYNNFIANAQTRTVTVAQRGQTIILTDTANLTILNPVQPLEFGDINDNSIVTKLQAGNTSFLFTGDAEEPAEQSMITAGLNLKSDILKVGHHGSYTATSQTFLDTVTPTNAIISVGLDNRYGHPHNVTLDKLEAKGVNIYTTLASGTIVAQTDGTTITFLNNPQPIPEMPENLLFTISLATALVVSVIYRKKIR